MYAVCEGLPVSCTFDLRAKAVLQRETEGLLAEAETGYERERQAARQQEPPRTPVPSRLFTGSWYQTGTWPQPRWVVAKAEANDRGTNRRFVVTNRPGAVALPEQTYDEYAAGGESEQWIKEGKNAMKWSKLSCRRFKDNAARLQLFALAYTLAHFLRQLVLPRPIRGWTLTTLREKLIEIGAKVVAHARYVTFQLAEVAVPRQLFARILERIARMCPACASG